MEHCWHFSVKFFSSTRRKRPINVPIDVMLWLKYDVILWGTPFLLGRIVFTLPIVYIWCTLHSIETYWFFMNLQWVSIHHKAKAFVNYVYTFSLFCTRTKNIIYTLIMSIYTQLKLNTGLFLPRKKGRGKKKKPGGEYFLVYSIHIKWW